MMNRLNNRNNEMNSPVKEIEIAIHRIGAELSEFSEYLYLSDTELIPLLVSIVISHIHLTTLV